MNHNIFTFICFCLIVTASFRSWGAELKDEVKPDKDFELVYVTMLRLLNSDAVRDDLKITGTQADDLEHMETKRKERLKDEIEEQIIKTLDGKEEPKNFRHGPVYLRLYEPVSYESCEWGIDRIKKILNTSQFTKLELLLFQQFGISSVYMRPLQSRLKITDEQSVQLAEQRKVPTSKKPHVIARRRVKEILEEEGVVLTEEEELASVMLGTYEDVAPELWKEIYEPLARKASEQANRHRARILSKSQLETLAELIEKPAK